MPASIKVALLLLFFALCSAAIIATDEARKEMPAPGAHELYSIVGRQLSAFRMSDFDRAYDDAAAGVQEKFSRREFEAMVRREFWQMTRPQQVEFGLVWSTGSAALVPVYLTASDGTVRGFVYSLIPQANGWKIDGVQSLGKETMPRLPGLHI